MKFPFESLHAYIKILISKLMADIQTGARGEGVQKARKNGEQGQPDASVSFVQYFVSRMSRVRARSLRNSCSLIMNVKYRRRELRAVISARKNELLFTRETSRRLEITYRLFGGHNLLLSRETVIVISKGS